MRQLNIIRLIVILISFPILSFGQQLKPKPTIVVGKVLSVEDSLLVKQLFFDGLREKIIQNVSLAADYFKRAIMIDPANDAAMYELANIYHAQNNSEEAEKLMSRATTVNPNNFWYWVLLEDIYIKTENVNQLKLVYDELIRLSPDTQEYYFTKASILMDQNQLDEAERVYKEIQKRFGQSDELIKLHQQLYLRKRQPAKAIAELEKQIKDNPQNINNYILLAEVYKQLGDKERVISILEKGKKIDATNTLILLNLADIYRALNRFDDAFSELKIAFANPELNIDEKIRTVLSLFPLFSSDPKFKIFAEELAAIIVSAHSQDPKSYAVYGDVLFQENKYQEALQAYKNALKLNNQVFHLWEQVIQIEIGEKNFQQAIADSELALTIFPNQITLHLFIGIAYSQLQQHKKAVTWLTKAIGLGPDNKEVLVQIYSTLGNSYNALKQYKESDEAYEKALSIHPANSYVLNNYAYYLSVRGIELEKAAKMSKYSIELAPNVASFEDTYAWILFRQKKYEEARIWIEKAIQDDTANSSTLLEHYGDILYHLGEKERAMEQWQKAKFAGDKSNQLQKKINEGKYVE